MPYLRRWLDCKFILTVGHFQVICPLRLQEHSLSRKLRTDKLQAVFYPIFLNSNIAVSIPWSRNLLEKLTVVHQVKKYPTFIENYGSLLHSQCLKSVLIPSQPSPVFILKLGYVSLFRSLKFMETSISQVFQFLLRLWHIIKHRPLILVF
jgi:hypothetical protein